MIRINHNSEFQGLDLLFGLITIIFNSPNWVFNFWIGNIARGGIRKSDPKKIFGRFNLYFMDKQIIDSGDRGYYCINDRYPTKLVELVGWIPGNENDRTKLLELGVTGKIEFHYEKGVFIKQGYFSCCHITMDVINGLRDNYPNFCLKNFTAIDIKGNQTIYQPSWRRDL